MIKSNEVKSTFFVRAVSKGRRGVSKMYFYLHFVEMLIIVNGAVNNERERQKHADLYVKSVIP